MNFRYLSIEGHLVKRPKIQLVGVCAMLIACKYEEMYIPQVWHFRRDWKTRCFVHLALEHFQWKNLHLFMVLDAHLSRFDIPSCCLSRLNLCFWQRSNIFDENQIPTYPHRMYWSHYGKINGWRLVPYVFAWTKYWPSDIQRCDAWKM